MAAHVLKEKEYTHIHQIYHRISFKCHMKLQASKVWSFIIIRYEGRVIFDFKRPMFCEVIYHLNYIQFDDLSCSGNQLKQ